MPRVTFQQQFGATAYADWRAKHGSRAKHLEAGIVRMFSKLSDEQYDSLVQEQGTGAFLDSATVLVKSMAPALVEDAAPLEPSVATLAIRAQYDISTTRDELSTRIAEGDQQAGAARTVLYEAAFPAQVEED